MDDTTMSLKVIYKVAMPGDLLQIWHAHMGYTSSQKLLLVKVQSPLCMWFRHGGVRHRQNLLCFQIILFIICGYLPYKYWIILMQEWQRTEKM